jgi:hypothetical protein
VRGGRGRRLEQLLAELKETRGLWKFKEEALECTLWRTTLEKAIDLSYETDYGMNERMNE